MVTLAYSPLPCTTPNELWQMALSELRGQMTKAIFNTWLVDSYVLTSVSTLHTLVIAVRNQYAQEWLTHRLSPVIARTLAYIAGVRIEFCFVLDTYAKEAIVNVLEKGWYAPVPRRLGQAFAPSGHIPQSTPNLKGEDVMTNQSHASRVRIYSHIIQSRFLHVEDALAIGKLRLFAGNYRKGHGMNAYAHAYVDIADARVIFGALAHGEQGFSHKEYKGTPPRKSKAAISRVLSVVVKGEHVYMELKSGPGKLTDTGAILPNGRPTVEVNVGFKLYEARRMAASVLAYIHVWDVLRMMLHQQMVNQPPPYRTSTPLSTSLLAPATNPANGIQEKPPASSKSPLPNGAIRIPVVAANGRLVTGKDPSPKSTSANVPTILKQTNDQPVKPTTPTNTQSVQSDTTHAEAEGAIATIQTLQYGNGRLVDMQNLTEVQTFQRYVAEKDTHPKSKSVLLAYYQQRVQMAVAKPLTA